MSLPEIQNLEFRKVTEDILLVHQKEPPFYFSCCDGLIILPKKSRNSTAIALDLNIEPHLIDQINRKFGPFENYVCTHGHMDHMAHVHHWEKAGSKIHAPRPESSYLLDLRNFYEGFGFDDQLNFKIIEKFGNGNKYSPCREVIPFELGSKLKFENFNIETIPLTGHSRGHCGFLLPDDRILHISCLGFDKRDPNSDGFGPWYGFNECSITQYLKDIKLVETIFLKKAKYLTSSHAYIIKHPDTSPFIYMREKIRENQNKVDHALSSLEIHKESEINIDEILDLDIFFPKKKLNGFILDLYRYWESKIIIKHLERTKYFNSM